MPLFKTLARFNVFDIDEWKHDVAKVGPKIRCLHGPNAWYFKVHYYPRGTKFEDATDTHSAAIGVDFTKENRLETCKMELRTIAVKMADNTLETLKTCNWKPTELRKGVGRYEYDLIIPTKIDLLIEKGYVLSKASSALTFEILFEVSDEPYMLSNSLKADSVLFLYSSPKDTDPHLLELFDPVERATVGSKKPKNSAANWNLVSGDKVRFWVHSDIVENGGSEYLLEKMSGLYVNRNQVVKYGDEDDGTEKRYEIRNMRIIKNLDSYQLRECLRVMYLRCEPRGFSDRVLDIYEAAEFLRMPALKRECEVRMVELMEDPMYPIEKIVRFCRKAHEPQQYVHRQQRVLAVREASVNVLLGRWHELDKKLKDKLDALVIKDNCTLYQLILEQLAPEGPVVKYPM